MSTVTQERDNNVENVKLLIHTQRQRLYPALYSANSNVQQILDHYAVHYYLDTTDIIVPNETNGNNCAVTEPSFKKSKHPPHPEAAAVVADTVTNDTVHNDLTPDIVGISKLNDENSSTYDVTIASKLNGEQPITNSNDTPHQASTGSNDMFKPSEAPTSSLDTTDGALQQESQQQQRQRIQLSAITASSSSLARDIWGKIPPKEYIPNASSRNNNNTIITNSGSESVSTCMMICSICQQKVGSSLRYASHLDKCLGIGTMSRNTNSSTTSSNIT